MSNTTKIYKDQNGNRQVVESGGVIQMKTGAKMVPNSGTQAATIAAISETTATMSSAERQAFNAVLAALKGVGILAAS